MNTAQKTVSGVVRHDAVFALFLAVFVVILLWNPQLAPTDDFVFIDTLQRGNFLLYYSDAFPYYDTLALGRLIPLAGIEYNLFGLFSSAPSPFWYFLYHAFQAVIFALLLVWLLRKFTSNYFLIYGTTALLMLTPGFVITMLRLQLNERNLLFFMAIFVLLYLAYLKENKTSLAIWLVLVANIIIYYKETAFLAVGAFAFTRILLFWKTSDKKTRILDSLLFASALAYFVIYFFVVYLQSDLLYLGAAPSLIDYLKRFVNYAFFTDSFIYLILAPIFFIRLYRVFVKKYAPRPLMDPLLAGATAFSIVYLAIGYGPYYLLPAYAFAIPAAFIYFFAQGGSAPGGENQQSISRAWKINFAAVAFLLAVNVIPSGIHYLTYHKYLMWNFNDTLDFLVADINERRPGERADIFLYGTGRDDGRGTHEVLGYFLKYKGLGTAQYDLKSDLEAPEGALWTGKTVPLFSIFQDHEAQVIEAGDYVIVPPQSKKLITIEVLNELEKDHELLFATQSRFFFPNLNMKSAVKYALTKSPDHQITRSLRRLVENENAFATPNYYVFVKR